MESIIVSSERLNLLELGKSDAPFVLNLLNQQSFIKNIGDRNVRNISDAEKYIEKVAKSYAEFGFGLWKIELKNEKIPVGICGLLKRDYLADVDLGYALLEDYFGNGYATESAKLTIDFAKMNLKLKKLAAIVNTDNKSSIQLLLRTGFIYKSKFKIPDDQTELDLFENSMVNDE
ncbi:MAG: GNAT family N-acetyltransferase [Melioribacteraceae bacterium]|nr:GNAT family N-acetyltransferase [Melioribacteraceae bacterium]MCF8262982.1 GNAT family N-acetyltransferase [Melioribacteraceae bacterium]MCF8430585.1 GNAT family N-acetyltransferase [Melioribacteraceae bacterium]